MQSGGVGHMLSAPRTYSGEADSCQDKAEYEGRLKKHIEFDITHIACLHNDLDCSIRPDYQVLTGN
jgi:hypothetical protein